MTVLLNEQLAAHYLLPSEPNLIDRKIFRNQKNVEQVKLALRQFLHEKREIEQNSDKTIQFNKYTL